MSRNTSKGSKWYVLYHIHRIYAPFTVVFIYAEVNTGRDSVELAGPPEYNPVLRCIVRLGQALLAISHLAILP